MNVSAGSFYGATTSVEQSNKQDIPILQIMYKFGVESVVEAFQVGAAIEATHNASLLENINTHFHRIGGYSVTDVLLSISPTFGICSLHVFNSEMSFVFSRVYE